MKQIFKYALICAFLSSCQRTYVDDVIDKPTDKINFISLTASQDTAKMFEPITITAIAEGDNLRYKWQRNKGSMVVTKKQNIVEFWGCPTCINTAVISCTVFNNEGSVTKEVEVFIKNEYEL